MIEDDIVFPLPTPVNRYYVYYDRDTGNITALANGLLNSDIFVDYVEISEELHARLSDTKINLYHWIVSAVTTPDKEPTLEVIPRAFRGFSFKNNSFDLVLEEPTAETETIVEWSNKTKHWVFSMPQSFRTAMSGKHFATDKLSFFIVLENDFDFLIRTIYVNPKELVNKNVYVPFETKLEERIDNIAVVTRRIFNNYGLIKTYE